MATATLAIGSAETTGPARRRETGVPLLAALAVGIAMVVPGLSVSVGLPACVAVFAFRLRYLPGDLLTWAGVTFVALQFASVTWSSDPSVSFTTAEIGVLAFLHFMAVRLACRTRRGILIVCGGLAWCAPVLLVNQLRSTPDPYADLLSGGARLAAEGVNPNYVAYGLVTSVWAVTVLWTLLPTRRARPALVGSLACASLGVLLAGTRGAELAVALIAVWLVVDRLFRPRLALGTAVVLVVGMAVAVSFGWFDRVLSGRLVPTTRTDVDLSGRLLIWPLARRIFFSHPLLGGGAGTFQTENPFHILAHNVILETATGLGIVGLAVLALIFVGLVRSALPVRQPSSRLLGAYLLAMLPVLLSGAWSQTPVFWVSLALMAEIARSDHGLDRRSGPRVWSSRRRTRPANSR